MCGCFYGFPECSNCSAPVNWRQYHIAPTGGAMGLTGVAKQDPLSIVGTCVPFARWLQREGSLFDGQPSIEIVA